MKIDISDLQDGEVEKLVDETVHEVTTKVTLDAGRNLIAGSPVDTGGFRGNWDIETPNAPYEDGNIENNKEYAGALAAGHSDQAPRGWVENACEAAAKL
ncbi:hypothetical protein PF049_00185 [Erythrobacteraceae bacterium WH01K]|nr:hypothetical protein PF049_00185 [Erythrobacteraceae bacterium WH01K]